MFEDSNKEDDFLAQKRRERQKAANANGGAEGKQRTRATLDFGNNDLENESAQTVSQDEFLSRFNTSSIEQKNKNVVINADISQPAKSLKKSGVLKKILIVFGCIFGIFAIWFVSQLIETINYMNSANPRSYDKLDEQGKEAVENTNLISDLYIVKDNKGREYSVCLYEYPDPGKCGYLDFYDTLATLVYRDDTNGDYLVGDIDDCYVNVFDSNGSMFNSNNQTLEDTLNYNSNRYESVDKTKPHIGVYYISSGCFKLDRHKEYAIAILKQWYRYEDEEFLKVIDDFEIKEITSSELETIVASWAQKYDLATTYDEFKEQKIVKYDY